MPVVLWPPETESRSYIVRDDFHHLLAWWDSGATEPAVVNGSEGTGKTVVLRMFAARLPSGWGSETPSRCSLSVL